MFYNINTKPYCICFQCLADPQSAQYNGGIVVNPNFNEGLNGWKKSGFANMATRMSNNTNNTFIVATNRKGPLHGFTQKYFLKKDTYYVTSGILQLNFLATQLILTRPFDTLI